MPYEQNEQVNGLNLKTSLLPADLLVIGDSANPGMAAAITEENLEDTIGASENFAEALDAGPFPAILAADQAFINALTSNTLFQQNVKNFIPSSGGAGGGGSSKPMTFNAQVIPANGTLVSYYTDMETFMAVSVATPTQLQVQAAASINFVRDFVTDWSSADTIKSVVLLNNFLYVLLLDSGTGGTRVYKYDATNDSLAGTQVTFSGKSLGVTGSTFMTCNGTDFFFSYDAGNNSGDNLIAGFSFTGSTFTYISTITMASGVGFFTPAFLVDALGNYYGFNTSGNHILQFDTSGTLQITTSQQAFLSNVTLLNYANTFYNGRLNSSTDGYEYFKIYIQDTDTEISSSTIVSLIANQNLVKGNTVGLGPISGGVAFANRGTINSSTGFPDTIDTGFNGYQIQWLDTNNFFILYKVSGAATLKGVVGTINPATMTVTYGTAHTYTTTLGTGAFGSLFTLMRFTTDKVGVFFTQSGALTHIILDITETSGQTITPSGNQAFRTAANNIVNLSGAGITATSGVIFTGENSSYNPLYTGFSFTGNTLGTVGTPVAATGVTGSNWFKMICSNIAAGGFVLIEVNTAGTNNQIQAGTLTGTVVTAGTVGSIPTDEGTNMVSVDCCYITDGVVGIAYGFFTGSGGTTTTNIATISGNTISLGTPLDLVAAPHSVGIGYIGNNECVVSADGQGVYVVNVAGVSPTLVGTVDNTMVTFTINSFLILGGYFITWIPYDYGQSNSIGVTQNQLFILGMSATFLGIAENNANRGSSVAVLIKGQDNNQTGLMTGNHYNPNGTGGVVQNNSGALIASSSTSVIR